MTRRITVLIDDDMYERLQTEIRHGFRGPLVAGLLKVALNAVQTDGDLMLGALIAGKYKLVPVLEEAA